MRILLPPSETKARGGRGRPLGQRVATGALAEARADVLRALHALTSGDPATAARALLLPPGIAGDALTANAAVTDSPTTPALRRYTGVVYDGLNFTELAPEVQRVAGRSTLIFSGLFGVVRGNEPVPLPGAGQGRPAGTGNREHILASRPARDHPADARPRTGDRPALERLCADVAARYGDLAPRPDGPGAVPGAGWRSRRAQLPEQAGQGPPWRGAGHPRGERPARRDRGDVAAAWQACGGLRSQTAGSTHLDLYTA